MDVQHNEMDKMWHMRIVALARICLFLSRLNLVQKRLSNPNVCVASAVHVFLSGAFLGNRIPWHMLLKYLICIIYAKYCPKHLSGTVCPTLMIFGMWVGLGPKVCMLNFGHGTWWSLGTPGVKNVKQWIMTTKLGHMKHWCKLKMMVTFMEVKGHQRSNVVNYVLWLPYLAKRSADAS